MNGKPLQLREVEPLVEKIVSWTDADKESISVWCQKRLGTRDDWHRFLMILAIMCGEAARDMLRIKVRRKAQTVLKLPDDAPASVVATAQLVSAAVAEDLPMVAALSGALIIQADEKEDASVVHDVVVQLMEEMSALLRTVAKRKTRRFL